MRHVPGFCARHGSPPGYSNPNIVTIHDPGETGTGSERFPFLVMEMVRGKGFWRGTIPARAGNMPTAPPE